MRRDLLRINVLALAAMAGGELHAVVSDRDDALSQAPLFLVEGAEPLVMLNMSNDHQLFFKAYDDYTDLDGDDVPETTYKHAYDYYGYFDSYKCYNYDSTDDRFEPQAITTNKYCDTVSGDWSGNFLNWASMSRIDTIRKMLYGGYRSTDSGSAPYTTVLERSFIPTDAHSYVKFYGDASDVNKLTPYSVAISLCNTTYASNGDSETVTSDPLIRVAQGDYSLWTAHEKQQCTWSEERSSSNDNDPAITGINASTHQPSRSATGSAEFTARVQVCVSGLEESNCEVYPEGNSKPIGLLQEFGESNEIKFGLITGSYQKNKSGGVVRKNIGDFSVEVESDTDGRFTGVDGIVSTLDKLRISNYEYSDGYVSSDNCTFGKYGYVDGHCSNWGNPQSEIYLESLRYLAGLSRTAAFNADDTGFIPGLIDENWTDPLTNDNYCAPVNVIQFNASTSSFDGDQLSGFSDFSAANSLNNYVDAVGVGEGVTDAGRYFIGSISANQDKSCTPKDLDNLSDAEGLCPEGPWLEGGFDISGLSYFAHTESIRSDLTDVNTGGTAEVNVNTYGVALTPAEPVINVPVPGASGGREVIILPACMEFRNGTTTDGDIPAGGIPLNTNGRRHNGNCAIVDFKIVQPHAVTGGIGRGKFYVLWESAQQGGDYDQDLAGIIEYEISSTAIEVTTDVFAASTGGIHGFGYVISGTTQDGLHIHSGHNDFQDYDDPFPGNDCTTGSIGPCNEGDGPTSRSYTLGTTAVVQLESPLYYAAKWGGFVEEEDADDRPDGTDAPNSIPDQLYEWDSNGDGLPDNYFFSTNPAELVTSLSSVFIDVSQQVSSSASTAANSQRIDTGTLIFQARFSSTDWSGQLLAITADVSTGLLSDTPAWDARDKLDAITWDSREIISNDGSSGIAFQWSSLDAAQKAVLDINPDDFTDDNLGEERLEFIRGNHDDELQNGGTFRDRTHKLGDLINSTPVYVGVPATNYPDFLETPNYSEFVKDPDGDGTDSERDPIIYVGGNDGMLHGFYAPDHNPTTPDPNAGEERLAFIPSSVIPSLNKLTSQDYSHQYYLDGSPTIGDVVFGSAWHTVLVSGLAAGGKGIYALDITDPSKFDEANADDIFMWEITNADTGFTDLGYTFSQPAIVKNHDSGGTWVAMFGNGYHSTSGKAVFYVVDIETGAEIATVEMPDVGKNGLSTVSPVDLDGDYKIDVVYAGDLKGNVWKIIPQGGSNWQLAFGEDPLFTAPNGANGDIQYAITARPEVGWHPEGLPGVMVYFGTGKYFEQGDEVSVPGSEPTQAFYAVWDLWDDGNNTSVEIDGVNAPDEPADFSGGSITRANLLQQCVLDTLTNTCVANDIADSGIQFGDETIRFTSDNVLTRWHWEPYDASDAATGYMGWYIELPETGEKQVTKSILRSGRVIFTTVIPSNHSCSAGGEGWLMELDQENGGRLDYPPFDLNDDGIFTLADMLAIDTDGDGSPDTYLSPTGKKSKEGIIQPPSILYDKEAKKELKYSSGSKGGIDITVENPNPLGRGRKSWIQLR